MKVCVFLPLSSHAMLLDESCLLLWNGIFLLFCHLDLGEPVP